MSFQELRQRTIKLRRGELRLFGLPEYFSRNLNEVVEHALSNNMVFDEIDIEPLYPFGIDWKSWEESTFVLPVIKLRDKISGKRDRLITICFENENLLIVGEQGVLIREQGDIFNGVNYGIYRYSVS